VVVGKEPREPSDGRYPDGSFNAAVARTLLRDLEQLKAVGAGSHAGVPKPA
jgi:hypothetical protein